MNEVVRKVAKGSLHRGRGARIKRRYVVSWRRSPGKWTPQTFGQVWLSNECNCEGFTDIETIVAIAYHLRKQPYVFPLVGGNKPKQLESNIEALHLDLTDNHIKEIESAAPFDIGYPLKYIVSGILMVTLVITQYLH